MTSVDSEVREKLRIRFRKEGSLRFVGHQDLLRLWERLLRRTGLPIRFTQGFNPKPRLSSPLSLAVGLVGLEEILEIELTGAFDLETVVDTLRDHVPEGLVIETVEVHPSNARTDVSAVEYTCPLPDELADAARCRRDEVMALETLPIERSRPGKPPRSIDVRSLILAIELEPGEVRFRVKVSPAGTLRSEELLRILGIEHLLADGVVMTRSRLELAAS